MCGIVGIVGHAPVAPLIVDALKRLEYRGYDSAGVATIERGQLARRRAEGKLINLERRLKDEPLDGNIGIGHTRWATHGVPNETNAHPHFSNGVAIVHNGIIENFAELRDELQRDGYEFASQTDTEVVAHLVARELAGGAKPVEAAYNALKRLEGAFALAIMFTRRRGPDRRRPQRPAAGRRPRRGRDVPGLRRHRAGALHQFDHLSRGRRLGGRAPQRVAIFDMEGRQVERKRQQSLGTSLHGRQGQPPPFHGEGNP